VLKTLLTLAALLESATGLALMIDPATVARLLLGSELSGPGMPLGRVAGFAMLSLGIASWPQGNAPPGVAPALNAMLTYNLLASLYLFYLGIRGDWVGRLLWPAVTIHAVLTVLLGRCWFKERHGEEPKIADRTSNDMKTSDFSQELSQ
jgi:hypothetical protein